MVANNEVRENHNLLPDVPQAEKKKISTELIIYYDLFLDSTRLIASQDLQKGRSSSNKHCNTV